MLVKFSSGETVVVLARQLRKAVNLTMADLTDDDIMAFGKHKGKKMKDVPHNWFLWMQDRGLLTNRLKKYAEQNVPILRFLAEKKNPK